MSVENNRIQTEVDFNFVEKLGELSEEELLTPLIAAGYQFANSKGRKNICFRIMSLTLKAFADDQERAKKLLSCFKQLNNQLFLENAQRITGEDVKEPVTLDELTLNMIERVRHEPKEDPFIEMSVLTIALSVEG